MSSAPGSFEEFWAASGPFFERVKHERSVRNDLGGVDSEASWTRLTQEQTNQQMQATDARLDRIASMVATVAGAVAKQAEEIESHERRLGRMEGNAD